MQDALSINYNVTLWILCYDISNGWNSTDKTASSTEPSHASYIAMWEVYKGGKNVASIAVYVSETEAILQVCIFVFKMVKGMLPEQLNRIVLVGNINERRTRQADNIIIQFRRTKSAQKSLFYEGIQMYDAMPSELKQYDRFTTLSVC